MCNISMVDFLFRKMKEFSKEILLQNAEKDIFGYFNYCGLNLLITAKNVYLSYHFRMGGGYCLRTNVSVIYHPRSLRVLRLS